MAVEEDLMIRVSSSNLARVYYSDRLSKLWILFHSGSLVWYANVPRQVYDALMAASSHGTYFSRYIRNSYSFGYDHKAPNKGRH